MTMIAPLHNGTSRVILSHEAPSLFRIPLLSLNSNHSSNASTSSIAKLCACTLRSPPSRSYHSTCQGTALTSTTAAVSLHQSASTKRLLPHTTLATTAKLVLQTRNLSTTTATKMSDEDYLAFLNKANAPPTSSSSGAQASSSSSDKQHFKTTDPGVPVPEVLKKAVKGRVFAAASSETESPFEVVALRLKSGSRLPDEEEFAETIGHSNPKEAEVEIKDPVDWDPNGENNEVLDAVREAGEGADVRVYEVKGDKRGVRVTYWVVTVVEGKKELLGVMGEGVFT
ncbi:hypothetical protein QBC36DRAFT_129405 [Triangularia setosa]|uniref:Uncharacterized protein n=1 Tax=Triangularia setosa TaxID=2587417 RepID=A0AAN6WGP7_9PEZI|nr:hypothetical protein QBC36DRAFT_129405 [Podospora setosa]